MNVSDRENLIMKHYHQFRCLKSYAKDARVLQSGTVGTVVYACKTKTNKCYAVKIQIIANKKERVTFEMEVDNQKKFSPFASHIYEHCVEEIDGVTFGIIVMDLIQELDSYLMERLSKNDLDKMISGITKSLKFLIKKRYTHGDLALFNIAITPAKKIIFIDFDRSSTRLYHPLVDILRLSIEWYTTQRSEGTKPLHVSNVKYIQKNGIPEWKKLYILPKLTVREAGALYDNEFETYCKKSGVRCFSIETPPPKKTRKRKPPATPTRTRRRKEFVLTI